MSFFISDALAQAAPAAEQSGGGFEALIFPIGLIILLYFLMIRPQVKRQKEHKKMVDALNKGDEVQTEGGIFGKITELKEDTARLEIAEGVQIRVRRHSIATVLPKGSIEDQ